MKQIASPPCFILILQSPECSKIWYVSCVVNARQSKHVHHHYFSVRFWVFLFTAANAFAFCLSPGSPLSTWREPYECSPMNGHWLWVVCLTTLLPSASGRAARLMYGQTVVATHLHPSLGPAAALSNCAFFDFVLLWFFQRSTSLAMLFCFSTTGFDVSALDTFVDFFVF